jgi:hypothetical protein
MDRNPYAGPTTPLETPTRDTVSMVGYGFLCLLGLVVILIVLGLISRMTQRSLPQGTQLLELLVGVQFTSWRFVQTHRRVMSPIELKRFALACAGAFWVFDELLALITRFQAEDPHIIRTVITVILASAFDIAVAAAIVYLTVPKMARFFVPRHDDDTGR